jgi:hypothetical protein
MIILIPSSNCKTYLVKKYPNYFSDIESTLNIEQENYDKFYSKFITTKQDKILLTTLPTSCKEKLIILLPSYDYLNKLLNSTLLDELVNSLSVKEWKKIQTFGYCLFYDNFDEMEKIALSFVKK